MLSQISLNIISMSINLAQMTTSLNSVGECLLIEEHVRSHLETIRDYYDGDPPFNYTESSTENLKNYLKFNNDLDVEVEDMGDGVYRVTESSHGRE